ncbi:LysR family transcriptional regulator [Shewanella sp. A3A]|nr:LysR family transcriptional regulator [Shewanella ferrihydritica]
MKLHQLDLNLLLAFDALMLERNVTRAATRIYLSQPAMSHALNRLRQAFNDPLLVRSPQGMLPTARALSLHAGVQQALQLLEQQLAAPEQFDAASSNRRFVISTTDYVECVLIPPLISKLKQLAPGVHIEIEILREKIPEAELAHGDIDLVLGFDEYMQVPAYLARETWLTEPLAGLVRRHHPTIKQQLTLAQLVETPHVFHSPLGTHESIIDRYLKGKGLARQISVNSQSYMSAAAIVSQTDHLLVLPKRVAAMLCIGGLLRQVALPADMPNYQLNCVWHPLHEGVASLNWLKGLMRGLVEQ